VNRSVHTCKHMLCDNCCAVCILVKINYAYFVNSIHTTVVVLGTVAPKQLVALV
jgi:hypothetical protein